MQKNAEVIRDAGGAARVATAFKISQQAVYKWIDGEVPAERVMALVALTGGKWTPEQIRPDIFGPAPSEVRDAA